MGDTMKYPYIGKGDISGSIMLFTGVGEAITIDRGQSNYKEKVKDLCEDLFKDITREHLSNTWGVVESKEHAEFIIGLVRSAGLITSDTWNNTRDYFSINYNGLLFWSGKFSAESRGEKQITIPLPPKTKKEEKISYTIKKGIQAKKGCEDFDLTGVDSIDCAATVSVSFNDNDEIVNVECESSLPKAKEWPQVGDEVEYRNSKLKVLMVPDKSGHVVLDDKGFYLLANKWQIKKPKTPEEEVEHNLIDLVMRARDADADDVTIARSILSKYNITKKDRGDE